jgi:hypothetical protein
MSALDPLGPKVWDVILTRLALLPMRFGSCAYVQLLAAAKATAWSQKVPEVPFR